MEARELTSIQDATVGIALGRSGHDGGSNAILRHRLRRIETWFRRLVTRWEYHIENFFGMVRLGCIKLLLRHI
jgi:hypothetical protein